MGEGEAKECRRDRLQIFWSIAAYVMLSLHNKGFEVHRKGLHCIGPYRSKG